MIEIWLHVKVFACFDLWSKKYRIYNEKWEVNGNEEEGHEEEALKHMGAHELCFK